MNKLEKTHGIVSQIVTQSLIQDACVIIDQAQAAAYYAVNETLIKRNWLLGMRIQHEVLKDKRAEYGEQVVANLAKNLTERYGRGYKKSNLYLFQSFYQNHPDFFQSVTGKLRPDSIFQSVTGKSEIVPSLTGFFTETDVYGQLKPTQPLRLRWTHYSVIMQENNNEARNWYEQEAAREMWSTRTLQRNVSSQYYHRLLRSANKEVVHDEMQKLTAPLWRITPYSMAATNSMQPSILLICLRRRNFVAKSSSRKSFLGFKTKNENAWKRILNRIHKMPDDAYKIRKKRVTHE